MNMEKIGFNGVELQISRVVCNVISCEYRTTRDYDKARVYALSCAATSDSDITNLGDDITSFCEENSMFSRNYVIMQSDAKLRSKLLAILSLKPDDLDNETKAETYDTKLCSLYEGKTITLGIITASISDLTGKRFTKWTPNLDGAKPTTQRVIPFVGDAAKAVEAVTRASAQVLEDCEGSSENNVEE